MSCSAGPKRARGGPTELLSASATARYLRGINGDDDRNLLQAQRANLSAAQVELLRWIERGSPEGRYSDYSHRISAAALRTRGLVKISGHGPSWSVELTPRGAAVLALPAPSPPVRQARV